jgi:hypothetical protein
MQIQGPPVYTDAMPAEPNGVQIAVNAPRTMGVWMSMRY